MILNPFIAHSLINVMIIIVICNITTTIIIILLHCRFFFQLQNFYIMDEHTLVLLVSQTAMMSCLVCSKVKIMPSMTSCILLAFYPKPFHNLLNNQCYLYKWHLQYYHYNYDHIILFHILLSVPHFIHIGWTFLSEPECCDVKFNIFKKVCILHLMTS